MWSILSSIYLSIRIWFAKLQMALENKENYDGFRILNKFYYNIILSRAIRICKNGFLIEILYQ